MKVFGKSDVGLMRKQNQDTIYYGKNDCDEILAIVCDGIGGGKAGDVASKLACDSISSSFLNKAKNMNDKDNRKWIDDIVKKANDIIFSQSTSVRSQKGMGTTLAGVLISNNSNYVFHLGDSRVYGLYNEFISLTEDHNLASDLIKSGEISEEDAINHPRGSMLTNALGIWGDVHVDINKIKNNYNYLLICSDGLHGYVASSIIENILNEECSLETKVDLLIEASNNAGGFDNVSVILLEKGEK